MDKRKQTIVINGINSDEVLVSSNVPQGSVLGPILLLACIDSLPEQVKSRVRLFADDTAMYLAISSTTEDQVLQTDLACLEQWEKTWDLQFNSYKCQVLYITRKVNPLNTKYILHNVEQESASTAKYLGVTIADDLSWTPDIDNTTKKANQTLGFLKRNIRGHNKDLKSVAYKSLVKKQLEYASTVWYPHYDKVINKVEAVQRRVARWATRDYKYTSSVTTMLKDLNWHPLDQRRIDSRLLMMYKVTRSHMTLIVAIPAPEYLARNTRQSKHAHSLFGL